ncbi:phosphatidylinositol-binding protein scs2 [Didymosphaeria variabile]|uniref:Phosphatidylinositol-binding protein scs2 n=1 Tax=Didymosphaeria variabile TaxID=1932322 RepID=A0A9W8XT66_9PLEO|nr:phosphatidylinositol-binding protein scs2 [Didymosphaeria variabile]KAJ4357688.1 phosphatidylinositol-binding protein scs2 [Didymosphaeria variabile]
MSVELDPPELGFKRPFQQEVTQTLKLRNNHSDPVAFKVKTTAPKQYCVRPNSGRIEPGDHVEVSILLQAMKEDPPPDAKCRDKFLVQSVLVTADKEFTNVASLWSNIEQTAKSSIQEKKIRVIFLPADGNISTPQTNGAASHRESLLSSPSPEAVTPQRGSTEQPVGSVSRPESRPAESKNLGEARESAYNPATSSGVAATVSAAAAGVANAIPTTSEELQAQLADAKATISNLRQQLETSTGLRQRKTEPTRDSKEQLQTAVSTQQAPGGVPIHIAALLALFSFLLAYFLF